MDGVRLLSISSDIQKNMIGKRFINSLRAIPIAVLLADNAHMSIAKKNCLNPTAEMLKSENYFNENSDKVKSVVNLLSDDESRYT